MMQQRVTTWILPIIAIAVLATTATAQHGRAVPSS